MRKIYAIIALLLCFCLNGMGQYSGTGTFNKISSLTELTDGYYVIAFGTTFAMNSTNTSGFFTHTAITPTGGTSITDPTQAIVWKIQHHQDGGRTIYSETTQKFVSYTGSSNAAYAVSLVTGGSERWTFGFNTSNLFTLTNIANSARLLQYNSSSPRFACYIATQSNITLYKLSLPNPPTLNPDVTNNTVDNDIEITFTDDPAWRIAINAVKIGGQALTITTDYVISSGILTLLPSGGNQLLKQSGIKAVTVEATGYNVASVSQVINPGMPVKLGIKTQPSAPATNGAVLATQPAVYIQDQYGNTTSSTSQVTASTTENTWTIGGTATISAVSGTANYTGLTATSLAQVTDAAIIFTAEGLQSVTSNTFNIPAPVQTPPSLTAAQNATVDELFNVTFVDNPAWRAAITGITVNGTALTAGSAVTEGQITFTPSASVPANLLQTSGSKNIVITATGYSNATVTQVINPGASAKLVMKTQPPASVNNGGILTPAVEVKVTDQYNNTATVSLIISASVNSGDWVLGGTTIVTSNNGVAIFNNLSATSNQSITGATIMFTSGGLTSVITNGFNIEMTPLPGEIVINQFNPGYNGASDEYIELLNKTSKTFDLGLLKIEYNAANGNSGSPGGNLSGQIGPYQYFLLSPNTQVTIGNTNLARDGAIVAGFAASDGQLALKSKSVGAPVIDGLAYGTITLNNLGEGTPLASPIAKAGFMRINDGNDSNQNQSDFAPVATADIYLRNKNSINLSANYTLPNTAYPADVVVTNSALVSLSGNTTIQGRLKVVSGTMTVSENQSLTINGLVSNPSNSGILVKSSATGTGSLILNTVNIPATIQRYITGGWATANAGWHGLSSPVSAQAISEFTTDGSTGNQYDFYGWNESISTWMNQKDAAFSIWNGGENFNVGQGYLVSYEQSPITKTFTGALNVANVTCDLTKGNYGWNFLGNPYSSALKWNDANWTLTNIAGVAKIWNEASQSYTDVPQNGIIPSAQGFMVQADAPTTLTIPAASRVHDNTSWYKNAEMQRFVLAVNEAGSQASQESVIAINPMATEGFDFQYDSRFLGGYAPYFYAVVNGEYLSTNSLPSISTSAALQYNFVKTSGTNYRIELKEQPVGYNVYLTDRKLNIQQDMTSNKVYEFTSATNDSPERFLLSFGALGLDDQLSGEAIKIYSSGKTIYVSGINAVSTYTVSGLTGQALLSGNTGSSLTKIDATMLPRGVYVITVTNSTGSVSRKVIL